MPKVLIVDDDPDIVDSLKLILSAEGYAVAAATSRESEKILPMNLDCFNSSTPKARREGRCLGVSGAGEAGAGGAFQSQ